MIDSDKFRETRLILPQQIHEAVADESLGAIRVETRNPLITKGEETGFAGSEIGGERLRKQFDDPARAEC